MSAIKILFVLGLFSLVTACVQQEEAVMVEPIVDEVPTTKF